MGTGGGSPSEAWAALRAAQRVLERSWGCIPQDLIDLEDALAEGASFEEGFQLHLPEVELEEVLQGLEALHKEGLLLALEVGGLFRPLHPKRDLWLVRWAASRGVPVWGLPKGWSGEFPGWPHPGEPQAARA